MDILEHIKNRINIIKKRTSKIDLKDLLVHLERADYFWNQGQDTKDDNYYTDVIYRTNQVFEGALREAYKVLTKKPKKDITTFEIEKYLLDNELLKPRVLDFFTIYRKRWRNESTHNYRLFFSESEALMAITSVSSFTYVLINQILETLAFQKEKTIELDVKQLEKIVDDKNSETEDKIISLIKLFYSQHSRLLIENEYSEIELVGLFSGFLSSTKNDFKVYKESKLETKEDTLISDMVFELFGEKVIIEFKRNRIEKNIDIYRSQLIKYLFASEIKIGIIFYIMLDNPDEINIEKNILTDYDMAFKIIEIY